MQKQMNLPVLKLKQDVVTRWNSTYDMLNRVVSRKDAVIATLALVRHELALNTTEWQVVEEAIPILKSFYEVTTEISTEKQVSLSKVIVYSRLLHQHISNCNLEVYSPEAQKMITSLKAQIHRRFYDKSDVESNVLYAEATILDPRFKNRGFRDVNKYERAVSGLKKKVGLSSRINVRTENSESRSTAQPRPEAVGEPSNSSASIWQKFDEEVSALVPCNPVAAGIVELDKYIQESLLGRFENPLIWWKERKPVYPILYSYILKD
ncbi:Zinc finger BED domain-containing protein 4 [Eumeta japonica]|uniref:Zinc finger BED domain-containing protein 4 n=1 Tax=Eumeta variegata TaxID=151549 RepID=A0A4C2A2C4_EUMVA|nr:Zinc finger BED domain-containing protein 4 [Eumeta japonica]